MLDREVQAAARLGDAGTPLELRRDQASQRLTACVQFAPDNVADQQAHVATFQRALTNEMRPAEGLASFWGPAHDDVRK